ncbi:MAG: hypothetical protein LBO66_07785 [Deltaproteobacteria bacterium]|jgi:lysozyme family protein|nr:hypothetical protein [Deltaproteobacteria bacterium]
MTETDIFAKVLPYTLKFEGGYVFDPDDAGGETFRGVSRVNNPRWEGWALIDAAKTVVGKKAVSINRHFATDPVIGDMVTKFYFKEHWTPMGWPGITPRVHAKLFDTGVHIGVTGAKKLLQRAIGVMADGIIGPKTIAAAQAMGEPTLLEALSKWQMAYYKDLMARKPAYKKYKDGWLARARWKAEGIA